MRLEPIAPGSTLDLGDEAAHAPAGAPGKDEAVAETERLARRVDELQEALYAEGRRALLIVLQGRDTAGKDGTIRKLFGPLDPLGLTITSFKAPSPIELAHDYLWRIHQRTPGKGEIAVFNRSHYEDVLVVRVHDIVPKAVWSRRFDQINAFEEFLTSSGTTIVKFFLWIDRDEQKARFQARLDDPTKNWKFRLGDLEERKRWDDYVAAYEDVLAKCSTAAAPWYVIPANRKWFRNLAVADILADTIEAMKPAYPPTTEDLSNVVIE